MVDKFTILTIIVNIKIINPKEYENA